MHTSDLTRLYPEAYHMAADGSWPSIARHGLLSTAALVERWEIASPGIRESLLQQRRPEQVAIEHPEHGVAIVRDHKPIREAALAEALIDMTPEQWFEVPNLNTETSSSELCRGCGRSRCSTEVREVLHFPGNSQLVAYSSALIQLRRVGGAEFFKASPGHGHLSTSQP
jgi:hypothetical protein